MSVIFNVTDSCTSDILALVYSAHLATDPALQHYILPIIFVPVSMLLRLMRLTYMHILVIPPIQATGFSAVHVFPARVFSVVCLLLLLPVSDVPLSSTAALGKFPSFDWYPFW